MKNWKPGTAQETLRARAALLADLRRFFAERGVLEVDTPLLGSSTATDVYIDSFAVFDTTPAIPVTQYLQTSPEFAMKRLLAAGSGAIYQLGKVFRRGESSPRHNPEFTLLEWYQPGYSLTELMDEVEILLQAVLACGPIARLSYRELFQQHLHFDPHRMSPEALRNYARARIDFGSDDFSATDYLQMLLAQCIEPELPEFCFIYDYPVAQAALARIETDAEGQAVARRFELFGRGMEIANGYFELTASEEQRIRFESDNARRAALGLTQYPIDELLLAALDSGLPACSGVALGVDRLLMLLLGVDDIRQVISFTNS
jgi:lysyl-tRNA synthetase class 2